MITSRGASPKSLRRYARARLWAPWPCGCPCSLPHSRPLVGAHAQNGGGKYKKLFDYVVSEPAKASAEVMRDKQGTPIKDAGGQPRPLLDAKGEPVIFDEGHEGWRLSDFWHEAKRRWEAAQAAGAELAPYELTLCEVAVLRLYTWDMYQPWNLALRGVDAAHKPDADRGLKEWATSLLVLYSAVVKLSHLPPLDERGQPVARVWRGVDESDGHLPTSFFERSDSNSGFPGGAEPAFMSTTDDLWTAYNYSGGWDAAASILEFELTAASCGAVVSFLSVYPRERELLLPPLTYISVDPSKVELRGNKRFLRCTLSINPHTPDVHIGDDFHAIPSVGRATINQSHHQHHAAVLLSHHVARNERSLIDHFTGHLVIDPVRAADGHVYGRAHLEQWFHDLGEQRRPIVSPQTRQPMVKVSAQMGRNERPFQRRWSEPLSRRDQLMASVRATLAAGRRCARRRTWSSASASCAPPRKEA